MAVNKTIMETSPDMHILTGNSEDSKLKIKEQVNRGK